MNKKHYKYIKTLLLFSGCLSTAYFIMMIVSLGYGYIFNYFWLILGIIMLLLCLYIKKLNLLPTWLKRVGKSVLFIGILIFIIVEGLIIHKGYCSKPAEAADYLIILGAKVDGSKPSKRLQDRLDSSLSYLTNNTATKIIVSGGQGEDEEISEALAMKDALIAAGIQEDRILLEDSSTSTLENFLYSKKFIDNENSSVIIVTSDYHMLRASILAKDIGYNNISGITAKSNPLLAPNFFTREFLAVIKDWLSIII